MRLRVLRFHLGYQIAAAVARLNSSVSHALLVVTAAYVRPLLSALRTEVRHRTMSEKCPSADISVDGHPTYSVVQ